MKISFFLDNKNCGNIDFRSPQFGNPGVGGTQYMFSVISWYYAIKNVTDTVIVYAPEISKLPKETLNIKATSLETAIDLAIADQVDYFICRTPGNKKFYDYLRKTNLKVILWGHNFSSLNELNWISQCSNVKRYVCVSKEQLKLLLGHNVYKKSTYIFNIVIPDIYAPTNLISSNPHSICYVGSIIESKGFDVCAKIWRRLYNNGYKVELHIIGSGQLYNKLAVLGKYKIADQKFEEKFVKWLIDRDGNLIPEVKFHGVLNHEEKNHILRRMRMGMPNPTGETETFGISAVEFEIVGVPVVTRNRGGLKDTVAHGKSGWLCNSEDDLYNACVEAINMPNTEYAEYSAYAKSFAKQFDVELIIQDWMTLFEELQMEVNILKRNEEHCSLMTKIKNIINLMLYKQ